jgi:fructose-specific phosphotransferase system IIC component
MDWVSLDFSYIGFFIIEVAILIGLVYSYRTFTVALKTFHLERYIKVKKEMEYFMIVWIIPLVVSILIRFIFVLESTGVSHFSD